MAEKDPILFYRADQPPGTVTLWVMVETNHDTWRGEQRDLKIGSADHLRYAARAATREHDLTQQARRQKRRTKPNDNDRTD